MAKGEGVWLDVSEHWLRAAACDACGHGGGGKGWHDDFAASSDFQRSQHHLDGIGSAGHTDYLTGSEVGCKLGFKSLHFIAQNVSATGTDALHRA